jgi:hypothetical protein
MAIRSLKSGTFSRSGMVGNPVIMPGSYESVASAVGDGSSATITFSSIPSTYSHLQLRMTGFSSASGDLQFRLNSAVTNLDYSHYLYGNGTSAGAAANASSCYLNWAVTSTATYPYVAIIDIYDYASTAKTKTVRFLSGVDKNGTGEIILGSGLKNATTAVTSISIVTTGTAWTANTTFALYGVN